MPCGRRAGADERGGGMLLDRMIRAARLDPSLYDEVERDVNATTQALYVVIIVSLASGIGGALGQLLGGHPGLGG